MLESMAERLASLPTRELAIGEALLQAGTTTGKLYFLKSGELLVVRDGMTITRIREPGAIFGEMSLMLRGPHTADVIATTPAVCHGVDDAGEFLLSHPELTAYVAAILAHRLNAVTRYLADVKSQYAQAGTQLDMLDEVLNSVMTRHPRELRMRPA